MDGQTDGQTDGVQHLMRTPMDGHITMQNQPRYGLIAVYASVLYRVGQIK